MATVIPELSAYLKSSKKNSIGISASICMQKDHYNTLATIYKQKGMEREAAIFSTIVQEFDDIQQDSLKPKQSDESELTRLGKKKMRNLLWQNMISRHVGKMTFVGALWLIGIADLSLYLFGAQPILHWFNDGLLIFIGFILMGTIILMVKEQ